MKVVPFKHNNIGAGPTGPVISQATLPPATTKRWVARRKAAVVAAVRGGVLTIADACRRYGLSPEEFLEWERHYEAEGLKGLRASARVHRPDYPVQ